MKFPQTNPPDYSASASDDLPNDENTTTACRFLVPADYAGLRLDQALARLMPQHSRSRLQAWLREGHILLDNAAHTDAKHKVWGGEWIQVCEQHDPRESAAQAEDIPLNIVFEDEALLVIDKPAGLVVHPGSGNWQGTLLNALLHHDPLLAQLPRAGIVHRLDKETSGLMVVAKTLEAQTDLVRQLQARTVKRHYLALATGIVKTDGCVDAPIGRHPTQRTKMAIIPLERHGKEARTHYSIRERLSGATLLECRLETGRTHQIRVHMAALGHALVGDPVYAPNRRHVSGITLYDQFPRQALHAWQLTLHHPIQKTEHAWESALPDDFSELLQAARKLDTP